MTIEVAYFVLRTSVGTIALWAGLSKVWDFTPFVASIRALKLNPPSWSGPVAGSIIAAELVIAASLLLDVAVRLGSLLAAILFAAFAAAAFTALTTKKFAVT